MFKFFTQTIKTTNDNIILATPLILFIWILSLYLGFSRFAVYSLPFLTLMGITTLTMVAAFLAGWFYMVKKSIKLSHQTFVTETDKAKETFALLKKFPSGIGKYFFPILGFIIFSLVICLVVSFGVFKFGIHFIGNLNLDPVQLKNALSSSVGMKNFLETLTLEQLIKLNNWNLLILATTSILSFLFMYWVPEIIYCEKNPFKALFTSVRNLFGDIWNSFKLFLFITVLNLVLSLANTLSVLNPVLYFIMLIIYFYFIVYVVVLIFSYYESKFTEQ